MEENRFKQRMIGAIVLIALAVIFLPMILNGEIDDGMPLFGSNIPEPHKSITSMTPIDVTGLISPPSQQAEHRELVDKDSAEVSSVKLAAHSQADKISAVDQANSDKPILASEKPQLPSAMEAKAWVVQVGSFTSKKNALALQTKLRKKKFNAFVEKITSSNGISYRVRIGPQINRKKAEQIKLRLKKLIKITGLVLAHPS